MANIVTILSDNGTMNVAIETLASAPVMEFRSGNFRSSPDERRVVMLYVTTSVGDLEIRFEWHDPHFVTTDVFGNTLVEETPGVAPYTEPRETRTGKEGR